jgi:exopolysaccharide production protein ExoQ
MPPHLALLLAAAFVLYTLVSDKKRSGVASRALILPSLWYMVVASRPVGVWFTIWGIPIPGGSSDPTEGSGIERLFYAGMLVLGLRVLAKRPFQWGDTFRRNPWLTTLIAFMGASILWSSYPYVSLKRYVKIIGSIVMAMVILTDDRPFEAVLTVLRRCLYVHLPMSIICTRYFREIGVSFDWSGTSESWQGISMSKNTLGQVAMLGVLVFYWELRRHWAVHRWKNAQLLYLLMAVYLLKGAPGGISMTSVSVCAFSLLVFSRMQSLRYKPYAVRLFVNIVFASTLALITLVLVHSVVMFSEDSFFGKMITLFGRDITLTDRTNIWHDVYAAASGSPFLGVGYGGFWIGRIANIPWNSQMTWVLGQGHSGYVDTYLQIGIVGGCILAIVLFSTLPRLLRSLEDDFDFGCFRITLFLTILFVNVTESTFLRGDHHLWLLLMVVLWSVRPARALADPKLISPISDEAEVPAWERTPR